MTWGLSCRKGGGLLMTTHPTAINYQELSDKQLATLVDTPNQAHKAFEELMQRYSECLFSYACKRKEMSIAEAKQIVIDVFSDLWVSLKQSELCQCEVTSIRALLFRMTRMKMDVTKRDALRRR